jgi:putrescine aminotransferase
MKNLAKSTSNHTALWRSLDSQHLLHPFTDNGALVNTGSTIIVKGDGSYVYDSDGREILDAMAGLWCVNIGYGRAELADAAHKQMKSLAYFSSFFGCSHPQVIELAAAIARITPEQFNRVQFTNSGSEAVDTAIKSARWYWELKGKPAKNVIIARENAYHGSTLAGTRIGGMSKMHSQGSSPMEGITRIEQPHWFENGGENTPEDYGRLAARALAVEIERLGAERVAAFIAEPVQGAGGVIIPPETYWPEVAEICRHQNILLIADEVVCGFGRLGEWFGFEHFGFTPDLLTFAKGVTSGYQPLGGVLFSDNVADVLVNQGGEMSHGFTYSGHPVASAVARTNMRIMEEEGIVRRANAPEGQYFRERWSELGSHPLVGEARALGFLGAIELVKDKSARAFFDNRGIVGRYCRDLCISDGVMIRAVEDKLVVSPPLILERRDVDILTNKVWRALDITHKHLPELVR